MQPLKNIIQIKYRAGALLYTLLIMLLLGVVFAMFLMRFRLHSEINQKIRAKLTAQENAISATLYFLAIDTDKRGPARGALWNSPADSFWIETQEWGLFRRLYVKAARGREMAEKMGLVGMKPTENLQAALFLDETNKPLKIVGDTKLVGDAYLPQSGLQIGIIGNKSFTGDSLIRGKIKKSKSTELNIHYKSIIPVFAQLIQTANNPQPNGVTPSFFPTQYYRYPTARGITGVIPSFSQVTSTEALEIGKNTQANLCVFYAPFVRIRSGFTGNIQVFATDSIIVEENVHLTYPSALVLGANQANAQTLLKIAKNSEIEGVVIHHSPFFTPSATHLSYTLLEKESKVRGEVITNGKLELKGKVWGFVACHEFQLSTPASVYVNHLLDAEINFRKLSHSFATGIIVQNNPDYQILSWLK